MELKISPLIMSIREELANVEKNLKKNNIESLFELEGLKLELHFAVEEADDIKGGFDLKVISMGGGTSYKTEQVQKITLEYRTRNEALEDGIPGTRANFNENDIAPIR